MGRCAKCVRYCIDEFWFWLDVFGEFMGWDRGPYAWVEDQADWDSFNASREADLVKKREAYHAKSS